MNPKVTPKDFFVQLSAAVALYAAAGALISLSSSIIDYCFPDALAGYFYSSMVAWPISMLVVLIPLLFVLESLIHRDIRLMPEKAELWIRRWRIYLTLFLSGATIIGDLIAFINTYLSGEITSRFTYKVLVILAIAGVVFVYYILDRKDATATGRTRRLAVGAIGLLLVLAAIVGGFLIVGSPAKQRSMRLDAQRANDLNNIQWQVINHWQQKESLPANLAILADPLSGYIAPTDPVTKESYEYSVKNLRTFIVCATFDLPSPAGTEGRGPYGGGYGGSYYGRDMSYPYPAGDGWSWKHDAGRSCFERIIDEDKFPPFKTMAEPRG